MNTSNIELRTPISYYGGKQTMLSYLLPLVPEHEIYTEAFFGGGALFWAKKKSKVEVINDLNNNVVNFYTVLKSNFSGLKPLIDATIHSRQTYRKALVIYELPWLFTPEQRAWAFWAATNMGFSNQVGSWAYDFDGKKANQLLVRKEEFADVYSSRLEKTTIESKDACELLTTWDKPTAFHYVDPPYVGANQGHYAGYTQQQMNDLVKTLGTCKGKFLLSSYHNDTLTAAVKYFGWYQKEINLHNAASSTKGKRRIEVVTANYDLSKMIL